MQSEQFLGVYFGHFGNLGITVLVSASALSSASILQKFYSCLTKIYGLQIYRLCIDYLRQIHLNILDIGISLPKLLVSLRFPYLHGTTQKNISKTFLGVLAAVKSSYFEEISPPAFVEKKPKGGVVLGVMKICKG